MLVYSEMLPLKTPAPQFVLPDYCEVGRSIDLASDHSDLATVVMFLCNHCPYVKHLHESLVNCAREYQAKGVVFIAISSNDIENYPEDGPTEMTRLAQHLGFTFPYCYDATQEVAKAYQAQCTPDFFVFDKDLLLAYRGRFDDSSPGNGIVSTGKDLRAALDALLGGEEVSADQHPSMGCNIKWIEGPSGE